MSLLNGVSFERNSDAQRGIVLLCNALDHVMFANDWPEDVWRQSIKTIEKALFRVRMDFVLRQPGMLYQEEQP